jgi:hypothetical protein
MTETDLYPLFSQELSKNFTILQLKSSVLAGQLSYYGGSLAIESVVMFG